MVAVAPLAIQQAHFFTVDGFFCLLILAAVYAILDALEREDWRRSVLAGVLTGCSGAVRMIGLAAGLLLLAGLLSSADRRPKAVPEPFNSG